MKRLPQFLFIFLLSIFFFSFEMAFAFDRTYINYQLKKTGDFKSVLSKEEYSYINIDNICFDKMNNLYIADSGNNRIYKFDNQGNQILEFGGEGQGPGEFLAHPRRGQLRITFGNNNKIYISDTGNARLSIFSQESKYIKQFSLPKNYYETPCVDSNGNIILISNKKDKVLDIFDNDFIFFKSILHRSRHFRFPIKKPSKPFEYLNDRNLLKLINPKDLLIILSNFSLKVFIFNEKYKEVRSFDINNDNFIKDFKQRIKKADQSGGFIVPFRASLDNNSNLCLLYFNNSNKRYEVYRYSLQGNYLDTVISPEGEGSNFAIAPNGRYYFYSRNNISVFRVSKTHIMEERQ